MADFQSVMSRQVADLLKGDFEDKVGILQTKVDSLTILQTKVDSLHRRLAHIEDQFHDDFEDKVTILQTQVNSLQRKLTHIEEEDYEPKMATLESRMEGLASYVEAVLLVGKRVETLENTQSDQSQPLRGRRPIGSRF